MHGNALQHTATYCNTLQHTDVPYAMGVKRQKKKQMGDTAQRLFNTLQHAATYCNTLQHADVSHTMGLKQQ